MTLIRNVLPVIGIWLIKSSDVLPCLIGTRIMKAVKSYSSVGRLKNTGIFPSMVIIKWTLFQYILCPAAIAGLRVSQPVMIEPFIEIELARVIVVIPLRFLRFRQVSSQFTRSIFLFWTGFSGDRMI